MWNCPACQASVVIEAAPNVFVSCVHCGELICIANTGELRALTPEEISTLPDDQLMFLGVLRRGQRIVDAVEETLKGVVIPINRRGV